MGSKSSQLERAVLDLVLGAQPYTPPAIVYVALYSVAPDDADGSGVELAGSGYQRVPVANDLANWPAATTGGGQSSKANGAAITFPPASAVWDEAVAFSLYDSATAGLELYWGDLDDPQVVTFGSVATFPPGSLVVTEE